MSDTPKARLILRDEMTRDEFRSLARDHGWIQHKVYDVPGENYEEVWTTFDQTAAMHYIEDGTITGERFLTLRSDSVLSRVLQLARVFRTLQIEDLCKTIIYGQDVDEQIRALNRLGVVAFNITDDMRIAWETGLFHLDDRARVATIRAMSYIGSADVLPLLEEAADEDPSEKVRDMARHLIESIHRHNTDESVHPDYTFAEEQDPG